jgi:hypothetical protein
MHYRGQVVRKTVARGSKSEHEGVVLITDADELKLRRVGGNPFSDPVLERLVGKTIECDGEARDGTLVLTSWRVTTD